MRYIFFIFAVLLFCFTAYVKDTPATSEVNLQARLYESTGQDYKFIYYEIICFNGGDVVLYDWSETDLAVYNDRLEYYSIVSNRIENIYGATFCKSTPPLNKALEKLIWENKRKKFINK